MGLEPLPDAFPDTRVPCTGSRSEVVAPARKPHNEIALTRPRAGSARRRSSTGPAPPGAGRGRRARVEEDGEDAARRSSRSPARRRSSAPGCSPTACPPSHPARASIRPRPRALAEFYAFAARVLEALRGDRRRPTSRRRSTSGPSIRHRLRCGPRGGRRRANYGASPGDEEHAEPYVYVGPWQTPGRGRALERDRVHRRRARLRRAGRRRRPEELAADSSPVARRSAG